jgi:Ca2+-transporting ATPase
MSEIMVVAVAIAAGLGQPLSTMQLLWINLISDIFPGLALALEPPEPDVLAKPPRPQDEEILQESHFPSLLYQSSLLAAGSLAAYGYGVARYGVGPASSTMAFLSLCGGQLLHAFNCRSPERSLFDGGSLPPNRYLTGAVTVSLAAQILVAAVPGLRGLLGSAALTLSDGLVVAGASLMPMIVYPITKGQGKDSRDEEEFSVHIGIADRRASRQALRPDQRQPG